MSTDAASLACDKSPDQTMTVQSSGMIAPTTGLGWPLAAMPASAGEVSNITPAAILHSLRRHWVLAILTGVVCGVALAFAVWLLYRAEYTATANLMVLPTRPYKVFKDSESTDASASGPAYELYRTTQQELVRSDFVLQAALREESVRRLPSIRHEGSNALAWLSKNIRVITSGKNSQILVVSHANDTPKEAAEIVNAVVKAYFREVVNTEQDQRVRRKDELDRLLSERDQDLRTRRAQLKELAERLGTDDPEALSIKQQLAVQELGHYRQELNRLRSQLGKCRGDLRMLQADLQILDSVEIPEAELTQVAMTDPQYRMLKEQLMGLELRARQQEQLVNPGVKAKSVGRYREDGTIVRAQFEQLMTEVRETVRAGRRRKFEDEIRRLRLEIEVLTEQEQQSSGDVDRQVKSTIQLSKSSTDVEIQRAEIKRLSQIVDGISTERERLAVELGSPSRIRVLGNEENPAEIPEVASNRFQRWATILAALLFGGCFPGVSIVLLDLRAGYVNSTNEVTKRLGLPVFGSVPRIPPRVLRNFGSPSKRNESWRLRFAEAVDSLAARVIHKAETEQTHVILITSASAGEGKSTLATQLAMSLARSQRRTVLIDLGLRCPSLADWFGLATEPGVCEVLRQQVDLAGAIQASSTECLDVLTAGRWDRGIMGALAKNGTSDLLDQLRAMYEFVIIDSSPVLPIADTRLVSPHVDLVLLSVFRDTSQSGKVTSAYEILDTFGVRAIEAVVIGGDQVTAGNTSAYRPSDESDIDDSPRRENEEAAALIQE